jgi:hypothetical protein
MSSNGRKSPAEGSPALATLAGPINHFPWECKKNKPARQFSKNFCGLGHDLRSIKISASSASPKTVQKFYADVLNAGGCFL